MKRTGKQTSKKAYKRNNMMPFLIILPILLIILGLLLVGQQQGWTPSALFAVSGTPSPQTPAPTPEPTPAPTPEPTPVPTPEPTPVPTPEPTPPPPVTDPVELALDWEASPLFVSREKTGSATWISRFLDGANLTWAVFRNGTAVPDWKSDEILAFGEPTTYAHIDGVLTFRGNHERTAPSFGTRAVMEKKLEIVWEHGIGAISGAGSYWPGTGWTGQPLLVRWPEETREAMNLSPEAKAKNLVEVVYPTLDGNIYFLDLENGIPTRDKINVGFSFKGTGAIDPRGYPLLFIGQGLNDNAGKRSAFKYFVFNLLDQTEIWHIPGSDPVALRNWGAFDSSGLVNWQTDTLIACGENGLSYRVKLNSVYDPAAGTLTLDPDVTKFRYRGSYSGALGIESSPAFYRNLMYTADNGGTLLCVDINTFEPVWMANLKDDTDATTTVSEEADGVYVYTANEVDSRLAAAGGGTAPCHIRKFNAFTGELIWQADIPARYQHYINGGVLGTPLVGKDDIDDLIIFNIALTDSGNGGRLIAFDKSTGEIVWNRDMEAYSWSSPVDIQSDDGKTYMITCDYSGHMRLFDPRTGEELDKVFLEGNIESSPAAFDDMIVVGSYARKIFGVRIR